MKKILVGTCLVFFLTPILSANAYWVWSPETGKFVNLENAVQDTAEEQYEYAMQFYYEKDLKEAIDQLENLLKEYPNAGIAPEAQYRLGMIYEERGSFVKAFEAYKKLIHSYPQSDRINEVIEREFRIGNLFLSGKKGKFMGLEILPSLPTATEIFTHIIDAAPYSEYGDKAQFHLGLTHKKAGRFDDALNAFQAVIDNYPQSELTTQARFQLAETSFARSSNQYRNERALQDASKEVNRFLTRYPESAASEQVANLRQQIDEKNAQKSYRIGHYYEKQNYLSSALIYYEDVAKRYPNTSWGQKASEKLRSLEEPANYIKSQEAEVAEKMTALRAQLGNESLDSIEKDRLERELSRLEKREKSLSKSKKDSLEMRRKDIKRRESELKEKFKKLNKKRKLMEKNPSEDYRRAMDRWQASLEKEEMQLAEENKKLGEWYQEMGFEKRKMDLDIIPFLPERSGDIEKIRSHKAKRLFKASKEKQELLDEKELLYKQHGEVAAMLQGIEDPDSISITSTRDFALPEIDSEAEQELAQKAKKKLEVTQGEVELLEERLQEKKALYKKTFGRSPWASIIRAPAKIVTGSTGLVVKSLDKSLSFLNPFDGSDIEKKSTQELLEIRMHLKERIHAEQELIQTLNEAFNEELALQERERLVASLEGPDRQNVSKIRKSVKKLEKKIRKSYQDIDDRHQKQRKLVKELDAIINEKKANENIVKKTGRVLVAPVKGVTEFGRAFLFGMKEKEIQVKEEAEAMIKGSRKDVVIRQLKDEIELQSLVIEAHSREIKKTEQELEILKAKASLAGGYKFRSAFVSVPYRFIGEAIDNAKKIIPSKDRDEMIMEQLANHTAALDKYKAERKNIEAVIKSREGKVEDPQPAEKAKPAVAAEAPAADPEVMKGEIERLRDQLKIKMGIYEQEKSLFEGRYGKMSKKQRKSKDGRIKALEEKKRRLLLETDAYVKELRDIEGQLQKVILKEKELEAVETEVLEERISRVNKTLQKVSSNALMQDLLNERSRIEERLTQIDSRRDFLTQELERFQLPETPRATA